MAVGINPRYNARTPPSSRMTFNVMPHIVRSAGEKAVAIAREALDAAAAADEDVWYADASAGFAAVDVVGGGFGLDTDIDAVAIDNRDRTRSRGYVVPSREKYKSDGDIIVSSCRSHRVGVAKTYKLK